MLLWSHLALGSQADWPPHGRQFLCSLGSVISSFFFFHDFNLFSVKRPEVMIQQTHRFWSAGMPALE